MAAFLGQRLGEPNLLSFDMGGTTAKGALIRNGKPLRRYEFEVAREYDFKQGSGLPLRIPVIDMIEIGAGPDSINRTGKVLAMSVVTIPPEEVMMSNLPEKPSSSSPASRLPRYKSVKGWT